MLEALNGYRVDARVFGWVELLRLSKWMRVPDNVEAIESILGSCWGPWMGLGLLLEALNGFKVDVRGVDWV